MALPRCPHCKLPLTEEEGRAATCAACGESLADLATPAAEPNRAPAAPRVLRPQIDLRLFGLGLALLALVGAGLWLCLQGLARDHARTERPGKPAVGPNLLAQLPLLAQGAKAAKTSALSSAGGPSQSASHSEAGRLKPAMQAPIAALKNGPPSPVPPEVPARQPEILSAAERVIDRPTGRYTLEALNNHATVKLRGRVHTLTIQSVDGESVLDALALDAKIIVINRPINGRSTVRLHAPGGTVTFLGEVNGHSTVEVRAPGGQVIFGRNPKSRAAIINGESHVAVIGRQVDLRGAVNGTATHVVVALTRGGRLTVREINGHSRLDYRRDNRNDPAPFVHAGRVQPGAALRQVD